MEVKTLGLLLHATAYLGRKKILKVFTPDGLITCISSKTPLDPFCLAEWVYPKTQKEIEPLLDVSILDPLLELRVTLQILTKAGQIAQDLLHTQMPYKPSPELFELAKIYFKKLPLNPTALAASFRLKLLYYEGLLDEEEKCFTEEELEKVRVLAFSKKLSPILQLTQIPEEKIDLLFLERL